LSNKVHTCLYLDKYIFIISSGSGGSGSVESITPYSQADVVYDKEGAIETVGLLLEEYEIIVDDTIQIMLDNIEHQIVIEILNDIEDWWNNEGGYGNMYVDLTTNAYIIHNNCYGEADYDEETEEYDYENQEEYSFTHNGKL